MQKSKFSWLIGSENLSPDGFKRYGSLAILEYMGLHKRRSRPESACLLIVVSNDGGNNYSQFRVLVRHFRWMGRRIVIGEP